MRLIQYLYARDLVMTVEKWVLLVHEERKRATKDIPIPIRAEFANRDTISPLTVHQQVSTAIFYARSQRLA